MLQFDESLMLFLETVRAELGRAHLLLVRDYHVEEVGQALSKIARPGYKAVSGVAGIPAGWTLFTDVYFRGILFDPPDHLLPLVPRSRAQVEFAGGLRIPGGRWHASHPPLVVAVEGTGRQFAVRLLSEFTVTGAAVDKDFGVHSRDARIPLDEVGLPDGNYRVILTAVTDGGAAGAHLTSRVLKLRSGTSARLDPPPQVQLRHVAAPALESWSALSAGVESAGEDLAIRGAVFEGTSRVPTREPEEALPRRLGTVTPPPTLESLFRRIPNSRREELLAAFDDLSRRGMATLTSEGPRLTAKGRRPAGGEGDHSGSRPPGASPEASRPLQEGSTADLDCIFDAMAVSGWGTWASLRELVRGFASELWEPLEAVRSLRSLGHIDVELNRRTLRPRSWSVAPPAIVVQPDGRSAFIAGWRSEELLSQIEREAKALGGVAFRHSRTGRPLLLQVHALRPEGFSELARLTGTTCVRGAPQRIAQRLPSIREIYKSLPALYVPHGAALEQFDFGLNKWTPVDKPLLAGAYRIKADVNHDAVLAEDGLKECDSMVAKFAGAAAAGRHVMSYDPAAEALSCLLGARPPGLYERALVLASGELPRRLSNHTAIYDGVPPEVASWMAAKLGPASFQDVN